MVLRMRVLTNSLFCRHRDLELPSFQNCKKQCLLFKWSIYGICMTAHWMDEDTNQTEVHTPPPSMGSSTHSIAFYSQSLRLRYQTAEDVAEPSRIIQTSLPEVWLLSLTHSFLFRHQSLINAFFTLLLLPETQALPCAALCIIWISLWI